MRPSWRATWENFRRSELPLAQRVAVALRNQSVKVTRRQACCGNHGEPGC